MKHGAGQLIELLAEKHAKDLFVAECKTGSSWAGCQRLDAWVLKRTWSPITMIGYEIKVSRSDFLRDDKWRNYLGYCQQFYFVCPAKMIEPEELPADVGLLWAAKTGTRLYTKRKAPWRDIEPNWDLMIYVLMSRTKVVADMWGTSKPDSVERWKRWLATKEENRNLGRSVSSSVAKRVAQMEVDTLLAESKVKTYETMRRRMEEMGFDPETPIDSWSIDRQLNDALEVIPKDLIDNLTAVSAAATRVGNSIRKLADKAPRKKDRR